MYGMALKRKKDKGSFNGLEWMSRGFGQKLPGLGGVELSCEGGMGTKQARGIGQTSGGASWFGKPVRGSGGWVQRMRRNGQVAQLSLEALGSGLRKRVVKLTYSHTKIKFSVCYIPLLLRIPIYAFIPLAKGMYGMVLKRKKDEGGFNGLEWMSRGFGQKPVGFLAQSQAWGAGGGVKLSCETQEVGVGDVSGEARDPN
ncbi:hypothetical protein EV401DRAFT_1885332 [Pisolithus croceorrhizus]|nr:hypothetical protein EV401DRAFT_1885332 [Pisolithus croceorrhizus]